MQRTQPKTTEEPRYERSSLLRTHDTIAFRAVAAAAPVDLGFDDDLSLGERSWVAWRYWGLIEAIASTRYTDCAAAIADDTPSFNMSGYSSMVKAWRSLTGSTAVTAGLWKVEKSR